jgi:hypothetical protein
VVVLPLGELEAAEVEPMSLLVPELELLVEPLAVPAPIDVPELVSGLVAGAALGVVAPAVVLEGLGLVLLVLAVLLLVVSLGAVDGVVLEVVEVLVSSCFVQALSDRAAIRARAAHCAIGDLIIRNSLQDLVSMCIERELTALLLPAEHFSGLR